VKFEVTEADVRAAAESVIGAHVRVAGRLGFGNVNSVYRVEAAGRAYALKVFRHADWPEAGKLPWVEASLARGGVPRAPLLHYTREAGRFPHGFSLNEFVEGENCKAAVRRGALAPAAYFGLAGALLKKVHTVSLPRYGYIGDGGGACEVQPCFAEQPAAVWAKANAYRFGFVVRYPWMQHATTGYFYESWHLRYIGVEAATDMRKRGIATLEQYFGLEAAPGYR